MELYIEYVILDNWVIDYMILKLLETTIGNKIAKKNKIFVCVLGVFFATFMPFLYKFQLVVGMYKILVSIILVMCIKKYNKLKDFATYYFLFIAYTFLIGGVILGVISLLGIKYTMSNVIIFNFNFPIGVFLLIILFVLKLIKMTLNIIKSKLRKAGFMYEIMLQDNGKEVLCCGFFDSGNNVVVNGKGVSIISINLFLKLYGNMDLHKVLTRKIEEGVLKNIEYINISGIGEGDKYLSFQIDMMSIGGCEYNNPRIAVAMKNFGDYDCILHKDFVKG